MSKSYFSVICICCIFFTQLTSSQVIVVPSKTIVVVDGESFYLHTVKQGETMYSISRAYNVSRRDIELNNPNAGESIKVGMNLKVPIAVTYEMHRVRRGETLFSIAKKYDVDMNRILEINPEIDPMNPRLSIRQQIKIPLAVILSGNIPEPSDTVNQSTPDSITAVPPYSDTDLRIELDFSNPKYADTSQNEFRIAMFLPLYTADNFPTSAPDSSMTRSSKGNFKYRDGRYWINPRSTNALEFYEGALLAVDSLKKQGLNIKLLVFDTMRDTVKMIQLLKSPEMEGVDMMIGPFATELVNRVKLFAVENRIYYISPTSINAESLKNNPYLIQVNAGEINTVSPMVNFISTQKNIHVTLIGNKSDADQTLFNTYLNRLKTVYPDSGFTVLRMRPDSLQLPGHYLKRRLTNVVIIPSANEAFVNVVTGQLHSSSNSFRINLYGLAGWTKFANLDIEYLHKMEFRYATSFYIDYANPAVQKFLQQFRKMYFTEPTMLTGRGNMLPYLYQYAFLGYDITYYFASAIKKYGSRHFGHFINDFRINLLQSNFHFSRINPAGGLMNTNFDIYKYGTDYTIVKETVVNKTD